jgi:hypothetical protein
MLNSIENLINKATDIVSTGVANLLMSIAFIVFLLAVINYIWKRRQGDASGMKQAGNMLLGSVFGLFIMVAVWGLVNFISSNLLGADSNKKTIERPQTIFNNTNSASVRSSEPDDRPRGW